MTSKSKPKLPTKTEPPKTGHEPNYPETVWEEILTRHGNGETIAAICRSAKHLPPGGYVSEKACHDSVFAKRLASARLRFADSIFDEAMDVARGTAPRMRVNAKGETVVDLQGTKADAHRDRLIVDTLLRVVSKINPAKYGERLNVSHSGAIDLGGVDDATLNTRIEKKLHELGVIEMLRSWKISAERLADFVALFRVTELPTASAVPRLLPGETELDL